MDLIQDVLFGLTQIQTIQATFALESLILGKDSDYREKAAIRVVLSHILQSRRVPQKIKDDPHYLRSVTYPGCTLMEDKIRSFMDGENLLTVAPEADSDRQVLARLASVKILAYALARNYPSPVRAYESVRSAA